MKAILSCTLVVALVLVGASGQRSAGGATQAEIDRLIEQLRSDDFEERQAATRALALIGEPALKTLRHTAKTANDLETRRRAEALANKIGVIVDAVAAIKQRGGTVVIDAKRPGKPVVGVTLVGPDVRDADMKHVAILTSLQRLSLRKVNVTAAGLRQLHGLTSLRVLELGECYAIHIIEGTNPNGVAVRVPFLQYLADMAHLEDLDLSTTSIGDSDLTDLRKLPRLRRLNLKSAQISGAGLKQLKEFSNLQALGLAYTGIHDADLEHLLALKALAELDLDLTRISDDGLKILARMPALRKLNLAHCQGVTDAGLERLKGLKRLKELRFDHTRVTNAGLAHLRGLVELEVLTMDATRVDDGGVVHVRGLTRLRTLAFGHGVSDHGLAQLKGLTRLQTLTGLSHVTDAGLPSLQAMADLQVLDMQGARVTDAGLACLKDLTKLRDLNLRDTLVTDAGLAHLERLTRLERLDLFGTKVTPAGLKRLRAALPRLNSIP